MYIIYIARYTRPGSGQYVDSSSIARRPTSSLVNGTEPALADDQTEVPVSGMPRARALLAWRCRCLRHRLPAKYEYSVSD